MPHAKITPEFIAWQLRGLELSCVGECRSVLNLEINIVDGVDNLDNLADVLDRLGF